MAKSNWENQADDWEKNLFYPPETNILLVWLKKIGKKKDKILDQGSGVGQFSFTIYKMGFIDVTGMDFSEKLIERARENNNKLKYKCKFVFGDIRDMPFKSDSFNIVVSGGIIEHVPETELTIKELSRVIKKQGYLLIQVPHKFSIFTLLKKVQQFLGIWKIGYEKSFSVPRFSKLLRENKFKILDYKIKEFEPGNHRVLGNMIKLIDKPLYSLGYGGHHMYFLCEKE